MKILGADGLIDGTNAMNKIPEVHVSHGDCCCAKYNDKFYWYILEDGNTAPENIPYVVKPNNGTANKRWVLKSVFIKELRLDEIFTNSVYQLSAGTPLDLNGVASLSGDNFEFTNIDAEGPPFTVNSQVMVENLNVEYLGGKHWSEWELDSNIDSGDEWIPMGADEVSVNFPTQRFNTTYSLITELQNSLYESSLYNYIVTNKTMFGFTVKLSSKTDNPYYRLQWAILGENIQYAEYDLADTDGNLIADKDGIPLTVL